MAKRVLSDRIKCLDPSLTVPSPSPYIYGKKRRGRRTVKEVGKKRTGWSVKDGEKEDTLIRYTGIERKRLNEKKKRHGASWGEKHCDPNDSIMQKGQEQGQEDEAEKKTRWWRVRHASNTSSSPALPSHTYCMALLTHTLTTTPRRRLTLSLQSWTVKEWKSEDTGWHLH